MRLAARSRTTGALAVAIVAAAVVPGTSTAYRLTHQEAAQLARRAASNPGVTAQTAAGTPVVLPNPDQQSARAGVVGPPVLRPAPRSELAAMTRAKANEEAAITYRPTLGARYSGADTAAYAAALSSTTVAATVNTATVKAPGNGFDYGDAAVGAGVTAAFMLLIAAAALNLRRRRQPQHS